MRNAIVSVTSLPLGYRGPITLVLNDRDIDIVARNVIFLLVFFVEENAAVAAEHVVHIWYSALIPETCSDMLHDKLKPLVQDVCDKIAHKPGSALLGKTWKFGDSSLRVVLTRDNWFSLLPYFDIPQGLSQNTAQQVRRGVMSAEERVDYVDRALYMCSPPARLAMAKFRNNGILLPFGKLHDGFTVPNPCVYCSFDVWTLLTFIRLSRTIFRLPNEWPMMDSADPTAGWSMMLLHEFNIGPAKNDVYGKLYYYLKSLFADFHCRLRCMPVGFELLHVDARLVPTSLEGKGFDRIDVSVLFNTHR